MYARIGRLRFHPGHRAEVIRIAQESLPTFRSLPGFVRVTYLYDDASGRLVTIQQMGFGLAVAVLLDATIVRSVLVPSIMRLLGDRNWYLPRVLRWLPDVRIEGEPARKQQMTEAGAAD
jgi:hypothetical protein